MEPTSDRDELPVDDILAPGMAMRILEALRAEQHNEDSRSGKAARRAAVRAYQIAQVALVDDDLWLDICTNPVWEDTRFRRPPRHGDRRNALKYVVRLSVGFGGPQHDDIVSRRYTGMKAAFARNESPAMLVQLLEEHGGLEGLRRFEAFKSRPPSKSERAPRNVVMLRLSGPAVKNLSKETFRDFRIKVSKKSKRGKVIDAVVKKLHPVLII